MDNIDDDNIKRSLDGSIKYSELPRRLVIYSPFKKNAINSFGIILYSLKSHRWHLVQRLHSPEYIEIIRGSYRHSRIPILLSGLSRAENNTLVKLLDGSFEDYINEHSKTVPFGGPLDGYEKFIDCKDLIRIGLSDLEPSYEETEWLWPKGRSISHFESPKDAAFREFKEETGIDPSKITIVHNTPIVESYTGKNDRIYQTKCWVCTIEQEPELREVDDNVLPTEIGNHGWFTFEESSNLLRNSKRQALIQAAEILNKSHQ